MMESLQGRGVPGQFGLAYTAFSLMHLV